MKLQCGKCAETVVEIERGEAKSKFAKEFEPFWRKNLSLHEQKEIFMGSGQINSYE